MILSITAAARAAGVSRTTIYEKVNAGDLSRTSEGIDTAELLRVFGKLKSDKPSADNQGSDRKSEQSSDDLTLWLREKLDTAELELRQTRSVLSDTTADPGSGYTNIEKRPSCWSTRAQNGSRLWQSGR